MAKKLIVNCATCDARKILEENYSHYEQITVNCATVLSGPNAKAVMSRLPLTLNCADVLEAEDDAELRTVDGGAEIKAGDAVPGSKYYMVVNGSLTIGPDTEKQLGQCMGMYVNGLLTCPESIYAKLRGVKVNGVVSCYPDGAIVLKRNAVIDRLFELRAKSALYWSGKRMIMVDPALDAEKLKAKGVSFSTKEAIVAESKAEALIALIDEKTDIVVVPDGTAVVTDDVTLDGDALRRYGDKLYVIGDVTVPEDGGALEKLAYLNVRGDAKVPEAFKEKLLSALSDIAGEIKTARRRGAVMEDKPLVRVTKWMLEQQPQGIDVIDCGVVAIDPDVPKELITERLYIEDCGIVKCSAELEDAVAMVCSDVGHIGGAENGVGEMMKDVMGGLKGALDTKVINAADYVL